MLHRILYTKTVTVDVKASWKLSLTAFGGGKNHCVTGKVASNFSYIDEQVSSVSGYARRKEMDD